MTAELTHAAADWAGLRVVVAGIGVSGFAAADALLERGARVVVLDPREGVAQRERGIVLDTLGADVRLGPDSARDLPQVDAGPPDLLVISPGWNLEHPVLGAATTRGLPIWAEAELAWRMRRADAPAPWLSVTGTRGKATTTTMLASMLQAAGYRATATGQAGTSLLEAVLHPVPYDVLAVQLSTFQLRWSASLSPRSAVCLNVAGDDLAGPARLARGRVYQDTQIACVYNVADPVTEQLVVDAEVIEGCRAIGFTLGVPAVSMVGLVEDVLCDRAFVAERITSAAELGTLDDVRVAGGGVLAAHNIANALAAAALARGFGVEPAAVRDGLRAYRPLPHRLVPVATAGDVRWVDDAAATDPVSAGAGLATFDRVVWVAGGVETTPETGLEAMLEAQAARLRAVVLVGPAPAALRQALQRHAPDVPVLEPDVAETDLMSLMQFVVARAGQLARPGDTVLLAPAHDPSPFGSLDQLGAAFQSAVRALIDAGDAG